MPGNFLPALALLSLNEWSKLHNLLWNWTHYSIRKINATFLITVKGVFFKCNFRKHLLISFNFLSSPTPFPDTWLLAKSEWILLLLPAQLNQHFRRLWLIKATARGYTWLLKILVSFKDIIISTHAYRTSNWYKNKSDLSNDHQLILTWLLLPPPFGIDWLLILRLWWYRQKVFGF